MKRILQAMDGVATKPVAGANDMARFLRAVTEADINQEVAEDQVIDNGDGSTRTNHPDGTYTISDGGGITTYDAQGTVIKHTSPSFAGYSQSTNSKGQVTKNFNQGPMSIQQGPQGTTANYQLGDKNLQTTVKENNISKFLSIVKQNDVSILNEGANPHKVSLPVQMAMQHYQKEEPTHKPVGRDSVIRKYFKEVEEELTAEKTNKRQLINQYASIIAERVLMKEGMFDNKPQVDWNKRAKELFTQGKSEQQVRAQLLKEGCPPKQVDVYVQAGQMEENIDEACWDKYKQVGMKKKGRKMVPNCVPKESTVNEVSTTEKQARTMAAAAHNPEFAKKVGIKQSVAKEFNQKDKGTALLSNAMKGKKKKVKENEIPGHSMGFTGGVGPGMIDAFVDEMSIEFDKNNPLQSKLNHKSNPGTIEYRIMRARSQIKDLATRVDSNELIVWESITRQFPELAMNIEEIRHGIEELAKIRKGGGRRVHNIPKEIGEAVMPAIKATTPTAPKAVKPKAKTSVCKAGQVQTGMQVKNGKSVPKCSVR